ncbi:MAG: DUF5060 domain-containing protein [Planctomycetota bacterium]
MYLKPEISIFIAIVFLQSAALPCPGAPDIRICQEENSVEADPASDQVQESNEPGNDDSAATDSEQQASASVEPGPEEQRGEDGSGRVFVRGELRKWHKVTLILDGPFADERDSEPNPFLDFRMTVTFVHEDTGTEYNVPGYFAADGNAANSSANRGTQWLAHFTPPIAGGWRYKVGFVSGNRIAVTPEAEGTPYGYYNGSFGQFTVQSSDKTGNDFRATGALEYAGSRYLRFAETDLPFVKAGPDSPETLLAYSDFDGTVALLPDKAPLKTWEPHVVDFRDGDPTWQNDKGRGLIGAMNYLSMKGLNACSFLTYNVGGDGQNVWPHISSEDRLRFDCSKLDQWRIVFEHAQELGLFLHFKLQETENDDLVTGTSGRATEVPAAMDQGELGVERRLYLRELIARFGHCPGLEWNLGEENTQSATVQREMAGYIESIDPYQHPIVIHTYPGQQDKVYGNLTGNQSRLSGASLQNRWDATHLLTLLRIVESDVAGRPWVVANDEQGPANTGVPPDPGYEGFDGYARMGEERTYNLHDIRKRVLWGNIMAGGAGVNYYFGYQLPQNDLNCEDFRSRDRSWEYCGHALSFIRDNKLPLRRMHNADYLVENHYCEFGPWCLAEPDEIYLVYVPDGQTTILNISECEGLFEISWFNPTNGDSGRVETGLVNAPCRIELSRDDADGMRDWVYLVRRPQDATGTGTTGQN